MPRGVKNIDPKTGEAKPTKPVVPRPVYIVYDTSNAVVDGKFNKDAIKVASRSAKEALETIDRAGTGANLSYFSIMLK